MSTETTSPPPRVLRVPRRPLPPAPRAIVRTLGRFPAAALAVAVLVVVFGIGWLWWEQRAAAQDSADRDVAIGGLVGDVNALRTAVADRGGDPDTIAPSPAQRLESAGVTGIPGPPGPAGSAGSPGASGAQGDPGVAGGNGGQGPSGPSGASGAAGSPGAAGPSGAAGASGVAGGNGTPGAGGAAGSPGPAGAQGEAGPAGPTGAPGLPGSAGLDGRAIATVDCVGEGASSAWVLTYSDGTTSTATGPCRLAQAPPAETDPSSDVPSAEPTTS